MYLVEVGDRLAFAAWTGVVGQVVVGDIDELEVIGQASIGLQIRWLLSDIWQVPQLLVSPVVQVCKAGPGASLKHHTCLLRIVCCAFLADLARY